MAAGAATSGAPFDTTGVGAGSAGRGRGIGGDEDAARWRFGLLPVTWFSQVVKSCAISDSGDRVSPGAGCGACERAAPAVNSRNDSARVAAPIAFARTTVPVPQRALSACRHEVTRN
jgi:hypothetical protein